jgi:hypothetical protein
MVMSVDDIKNDPRWYAMADERVRARVEQQHDEGYHELLELLYTFFGTAGVRGLSEFDRDALRSALVNHATAVAKTIESHHTSIRCDEAQRGTWDMLRAVFAGAANERRNITGEEPDEFTRSLVLGGEKGRIGA